VYTAGGNVLVGTARWHYEMEARENATRARAERLRRRKANEQVEARLKAQIAALQAELESQRLESEMLSQEDSEAQNRRGGDHAELLRLRRADADTDSLGGSRHAGTGR
jgi:circadian clock protein KaiC